MPPTTVLTVLMMPLVSLSGEMPSVRVAGRYCARGRFVSYTFPGPVPVPENHSFPSPAPP
ncbi:hypothetical protein GCM10010328_58780 [Streptomyces rubiginosohelvolus]|uniref:Secreted protein n=1 Tax=Streptomyces rubiginosohelvolus TaxID=67362 RepID=A0ABQ3CB73_9ACTN|nr:hypothetical protein GCM10010328_58780 [Streptomyces pluricolorescens]